MLADSDLVEGCLVAQLPLEVRSMTLAINVADCADRSLHRLCDGIYQKVTRGAARFAEIAGDVAAEYGVPILQRRLAVSGVSEIADGFGPEDLLHVARTLDGAAAQVHAERIGGFSADARFGLSNAASQVIASLPVVLAETTRVRAAVQVAATQTGVNMSAVALVAQKMREAADASADKNADASARLTVVANDCLGHPHLTSCTTQPGWVDRSIHVSVGAAAVLKHALEVASVQRGDLAWTTIAEILQTAGYRSIKAAEIIGREVAKRMGVTFGFVDPTLAPTIRGGDSVVGLFPLLGVESFGAPGTVAVLTLLRDVMQRAARFASPGRHLEARVMLSVLEDPALAEATHQGLSFDRLQLLAAAGACGLDLIPIPGAVDADTLSAIIADQMVLSVSRGQTGSVRVIPIPGRGAGERVTYGSMLGEASILDVAGIGRSRPMTQRGGIFPTSGDW
ncbi:MAG: DUF711 family protein [Planctomycetaceae bacterium]|nr:DUF711 family protein [Planctomycetaceae bacterium]